jgi:hypothetical protein
MVSRQLLILFLARLSIPGVFAGKDFLLFLIKLFEAYSQTLF